MKKDFWSNSVVAIMGGGSFGTVLANLIAPNVKEVKIWVRDESQARTMNSNRENIRYLPDVKLHQNIRVLSSLNEVFEGHPNAVIWALPAKSVREVTKSCSSYFLGSEIVLHATKGIEEGSMKRITQILAEELPLRRIGVISGPNLAKEIARNEPSATVVASHFKEVTEAGAYLLRSPSFRVYEAFDVAGVEWAGTLKNIYALASGMLDTLNFGQNARALLLTRSLTEMVKFGKIMGGEEETFLGLAGVGDLIATCSSPLSRNYRVGKAVAEGKDLETILKELNLTAEGVRTTQIVNDFAKERGLLLPIADAVYQILFKQSPVHIALKELMMMPVV